ncbi:MAG: fatty acid desaturase [Myxococcales bacterium]|nr:fatty acid desaturase [Myxococcales bacterium]
MIAHRIPYYAAELKAALPPRVFAPSRSRLIWLPVHLTVIALSAILISQNAVSWVVASLLSLVIGASFAGLTFLAHETLHGAIVRSSRLRYALGMLLLLPFVLSPRLWIAWHNRVHHGNANRPGVDPDANPTLAEYRASRRIRLITDHFALGRRSWTGIFGLFLGFSVQSAHMLYCAHRRGILSARARRMAMAETAAGIALWTALAIAVGFPAFVFVFVVPLIVANTIVMAFIMTNHSLSPLTDVNDPLLNSLSVTAPRWVEWLTLHFGYHVEHHLLPSVSSRHGRRVREVLRRRWPERYQSMSLLHALRSLHCTARVYEEPATLLDPRTGHRYAALLPLQAVTPTPPRTISASHRAGACPRFNTTVSG